MPAVPLHAGERKLPRGFAPVDVAAIFVATVRVVGFALRMTLVPNQSLNGGQP
jgi:hypothetical protein